MRNALTVFIGGLVAGLVLALTVAATQTFLHEASHRNAQICALDKAIVKVLATSEKNLPPAHKYDRYRLQYEGFIVSIQAVSAC